MIQPHPPLEFLVLELLPVIRDIIVIVCALVSVITLFVVLKRLGPLLDSLNQLAHNMATAVESMDTPTKHLGETLISVRALTDAMIEMQRESIAPALENVEEMSERLNKSVRELSYAAEDAARFSRATIRRATHYRDKVFRPIIEVASIWSGVRAVTRAMPLAKMITSRRRNRKKGWTDGT
ncbi:MAG: hypothetical protein O3A46_17180 [Candidatus Poribacteria bacterium]|nr:hypothetical protein [Candidatus Poribacteria bacterium]